MAIFKAHRVLNNNVYLSVIGTKFSSDDLQLVFGLTNNENKPKANLRKKLQYRARKINALLMTRGKRLVEHVKEDRIEYSVQRLYENHRYLKSQKTIAKRSSIRSTVFPTMEDNFFTLPVSYTINMMYK